MSDELSDGDTTLVRHVAARALITDPRIDLEPGDYSDVENAMLRAAHDAVDGVYYDGPDVEPLAVDDDVEQLVDELESAAVDGDDVTEDDLLEWATRLRQASGTGPAVTLMSQSGDVDEQIELAEGDRVAVGPVDVLEVNVDRGGDDWLHQRVQIGEHGKLILGYVGGGREP